MKLKLSDILEVKQKRLDTEKGQSFKVWRWYWRNAATDTKKPNPFSRYFTLCVCTCISELGSHTGAGIAPYSKIAAYIRLCTEERNKLLLLWIVSEFTVPAASKRNDRSFQWNQRVLSQLELNLQRGKIILNITSPTNTQSRSAGIGNYTGMVPFACVENISKYVALLLLCQLGITAVPMGGNNLRDFCRIRIDASGSLKLFPAFFHLA